MLLVVLIGLVACNPQTQNEAPPQSDNHSQTSPEVGQSKDEPSPQSEGIPLVSIETLQSDKQRQTSPQVDLARLAALVDGNSKCAFNIYRMLKETDGNLFYSPYSISEALAMTYAGARGDTEKQMAAALSFDLPQNQLHNTFNSLDQSLAHRGEGTQGTDGKGFRLHVVNAIWSQRDYKFLSDFLDVLAVNYGAGMRTLNFRGSPEPSRVTINKWVSDQTERKINNLIPPGEIGPLTRLVLTNAIYLDAAWLYPFNEKATYNSAFRLLDGSTVSVLMMRQTESFGYSEGKDYQAVELPYDGNQLSMVILLPQDGKFKEFEQSLDAGNVAAILKDIEVRRHPSDRTPPRVALAMPKFKYESAFQLAKALRAMGMPDAFGANADFSGMTGTHELFIGEVIHKAFVSVDEQGTVAAAATAVMMVGSPPGEPVRVFVDRPFIFLIRDMPTGTILFMGRVINPGA